MSQDHPNTEGLRERKRRETLLRIAENGLRLFDENGYDSTTLETVAKASNVSARTLFHYFKTKDEILQFWQGSGFIEALGPALLSEPIDQGPLRTVHACLQKLISRYETDRSAVVDRILNSTEVLRARKLGIFLQMEKIVFAALCERWPQQQKKPMLRSVAMSAIGAMRLAMEARRESGSSRSLAHHLDRQMALIASMN